MLKFPTFSSRKPLAPFKKQALLCIALQFQYFKSKKLLRERHARKRGLESFKTAEWESLWHFASPCEIASW